MCNEVKFDINLKLTKFALKWVLTWSDSFIFKYCNHGKYVKFHLKMKRLHPRAGPSSRHMAICVLTAFRPSFPHLETLKKILENSTLSRYVKKKKKISRPTDPIFKFWSGEGNITIFFFFGLINDKHHYHNHHVLIKLHQLHNHQYRVEPIYNEDLGTMKITLLYIKDIV